jgi:type IV fimbrial biogenesis protein FimT
LGFSLVELMIGVAIIGLLMSFAAPNLRDWFLNAQIRNAADSILNGMQQARAEALAQSVSVAFVLQPEVGKDTTSWDIFVVGSTVAIASRLSSEGSDSVKRTVTPGGATTVTFDFAGMPLAGGITSVTLDSTVLSAAASKDLTVTVGVSGSTRMCDPNVASPSPRAC